MEPSVEEAEYAAHQRGIGPPKPGRVDAADAVIGYRNMNYSLTVQQQ